MKRNLLVLILILNLKISFSQQLFKDYGERETTEELNIELLKLVCKNSKIQFENIYLDKSFSKMFDENTTFFTVRYITEKLEFENIYTTKFMTVNNKGEVIKEINNNNLSYSDDEAGQPNSTRILSKLIPLNKRNFGIGLITEFYSPSRVSLYSEELFTIISLDKKSSKIVLENYPIRMTIGESNGSGTYEMETMDALIYLEETKSNKYYDFKVLQQFIYQNHIEEDVEKGLKELNDKKEAKETETLRFDGEQYVFKKPKYKFLNND